MEPDPEPWSDALALALASALEDSPDRSWVRRTRTDPEARRELFRVWRNAHPALLGALDDHAPEVLAEELDRVLADWRLEDVLLLLLSDPHDEGLELARFFVEALGDVERRRRAETILRTWTEPDPPASRVRILVVGGIEREARAQRERLLALGREGIEWIAVSRGKGRGFNREVLSRVQQAQALVLVTGRVSHVLAQAARAEAEARGVPVYYLERASGRQLDEVLDRIDREYG